MYRMRTEDSSVYLYIKDTVLSPFIETQLQELVVFEEYMSSDTSHVYSIESDLEPSPFERGRGLVYFDDLINVPLVPDGTVSGTKEQRNRVKLYDEAMTLIDDNSYMVDYVDGRFITYPNIKPTYVSYDWNYVSVVDEWSAIIAADPPVVVIDLSATKKEGFQLGGGKKVTRKGTLIIFASSTSERNDLAEVLYDGLYLKSCPNYAFPEGTVLDYDGTFNGRKNVLDKDANEFSREILKGVSDLKFDNVEMKHINLSITMNKGKDEVALSDLNAYRSKITFDLVSWVEG